MLLPAGPNDNSESQFGVINITYYSTLSHSQIVSRQRPHRRLPHPEKRHAIQTVKPGMIHGAEPEHNRNVLDTKLYTTHQTPPGSGQPRTLA